MSSSGAPVSAPAEPSMRALLEARSVAVVGASQRPDSFGARLMGQLAAGGFDGEVWPVNPRYSEVEGLPCVPSISDLDQAPDLVVLAVSNLLIEEQLKAAAEHSCRSGLIFASLFEATPEGQIPLVDRVAAIARSAGMVVCGGNCMGFLNLDCDLRLCGYGMPPDLAPGAITFITHSGSAFAAMLYNNRPLRFNLVVSSGQELVTTSADYLEYALDQPSTGAIAMFIETATDPPKFRAALERAANLDVPVVVLKVGQTPRSHDLVIAHSGALAGADEAYDALFDAYGVVRVRSFAEMADTLELFTAGRRAGPGGLASIHDSGGERVLFADEAAVVGVAQPDISESTRARLDAVLEEGLAPGNPLDAWGTGNDYEDIFIESAEALLDDPAMAALVLCVDLTTEMYAEAGYVKVAKHAWASGDKPLAVLSNFADAIDGRDAASLRAAGIPVLEGTTSGLLAFKHLFGLRDHRAMPVLVPPEWVPQEVRDRWRARIASDPPLSETESLLLLADYGVPVVPSRPATDCHGAIRAAEVVGWPVALKTAEEGVAHKSDAGGVKLNLAGPQDLEFAYSDMAGRLGPAVTVAGMAPPGTELALGMVRDPQFGPLIMAAAGGVLVEILGDRKFGFPPLDVTRALNLLKGLRVRALLDGARGAPPADIDAVAGSLVAFSRLALDLGDLVAALDVNPLIAGPEGCVAVDALVVPV
ncbi:MAG: acetate--CoA ligase family protein [Actinomycetota bacterium]|nr:acetate--CoA ligase family protein [Actinomycetota bacterium]